MKALSKQEILDYLSFNNSAHNFQFYMYGKFNGGVSEMFRLVPTVINVQRCRYEQVKTTKESAKEYCYTCPHITINDGGFTLDRCFTSDPNLPPINRGDDILSVGTAKYDLHPDETTVEETFQKNAEWVHEYYSKK